MAQTATPLESTQDEPTTISHATSVRPRDKSVSNTSSDDELSRCHDAAQGEIMRRAGAYPEFSGTTILSPFSDLDVPIYIEITSSRHQRALLHHFNNELSTLMTFHINNGNPFRELVLPLCGSSPSLLYAVLALSCAHLEFKGIENEQASMDLHTKAVHFLSESLSRSERGHELVATILMLIYYEALVNRGKFNILQEHLRAALSMVRPVAEDDSATNRFLSLALYFHDVIAALSSGTAAQSLTLGVEAIALPSNESHSSPAINSVLGMTTELWPIIHEISQVMKMRKEVQIVEFLGYKDAANALRVVSEGRSSDIESRLKNWQASRGDEFNVSDAGGEDKTDDCIQSAKSNAKAYLHAAFVYFYRNIQSLGRRAPLVQYHAREALTACLRVVMFAGPMAALLWPLFISSCEAVNLVERETARTVFRAIMEKQGFVNIADSWNIVQEVWREGDEKGREIAWEETGQAKGISLVFA